MKISLFVTVIIAVIVIFGQSLYGQKSRPTKIKQDHPVGIIAPDIAVKNVSIPEFQRLEKYHKENPCRGEEGWEDNVRTRGYGYSIATMSLKEYEDLLKSYGISVTSPYFSQLFQVSVALMYDVWPEDIKDEKRKANFKNNLKHALVERVVIPDNKSDLVPLPYEKLRPYMPSFEESLSILSDPDLNQIYYWDGDKESHMKRSL